MFISAVVSLRPVKRRAAILSLACLIVFVSQPHPLHAGLTAPSTLEKGRVAQRYILPITPPLDQGDSDLCWVFATLSMLETNYLYRHPGSHIALSRAAVQLDSISDRLERRIRGQPIPLEDGGLAVEALALIRQNGLLAERDFHGIVDSDPIFASIHNKLARYADPSKKQEALEEELRASLGAPPQITDLDGKTMSPRQLADAVLGKRQWVEFDVLRDGAEKWGPSRDPDARPETRVRYVKLNMMIDLIRQSLASGRAVVAGSTDHALLIYGADYDKDGKPLSYFIKDSFAPYTYRASAEQIHGMLHDVTAAF